MAATNVLSPRAWMAAAAVVLMLGQPVGAQVHGPDSVADVAAPLLDAVVNISTSQTVASSRSAVPTPQLPEGSPFQDFFNDFFNEQDGNGSAPRRVQSLGSGFVIDPSGLIVTNHHVIAVADEITANFTDGRKLIAKLIGHDEKTDIALLLVESETPLKAVAFGNSDTIRVGDWVMAIGNPFGLGGTLTVGIVSARNRVINSGPYDDFIQTDAAINRGNSGGPLFNMKGEVIGVNTAIISPTGGSIGIGFAVPSKIANNVIGQLREFGETRRGWIGVRIQEVTDDVAKGLGLASAKGALIAGVDESGPAAAGGMKAGDVVVNVDGQAIDRMSQLPRLVADLPVGKTVSVVVLRDGKEETLSVTLGRLEESEQAAASPDATDPEEATKPDAEGTDQANEPPASTDEPVAVVTGPLGLGLEDLSPDTRGRFGIAADVGAGVVVTAVQPGSAAEDKRLQAGDVIVEIAQEPVKSTEEVNARLEALRAEGRTSVQLVVQNAEGHVRWVNLPLTE
jgi:serine protease Do